MKDGHVGIVASNRKILAKPCRPIDNRLQVANLPHKIRKLCPTDEY
jgi:hypothetical protein